MKAKKAISLFLALVMALSCMSLSAFADATGNWTDEGNYDASWLGKYETTANYTIANAGDLAAFAKAVNSGNTFEGKTVTVTAESIDLSAHYWTPIGTGGITDGNGYVLTTGSKPFAGTFDGSGHTISGLTVDAGSNPAGLFGVVANEGSVSNLNVQVAGVTGTGFVGGVTGILYGGSGSVSCCNVTFANNGTISGTHFVGGIAGYAIHSATISGCHVTGGVISATDSNHTCDGDDVGGIVGYTYDSVSVNSCFVGGSKISAVRQGGGIVGLVNKASVSNCTATNVTIESATDTKANSEKYTKIAFGGLVGAFCNGGCTLRNSTVDGATLTFAQGAVTNNVRMGAITGGVYELGKEASHKYTVTNTTSSGCTLEIPDAAQLAKFRDAVNAGDSFYGNTVKLTQDITLDAGWTPIGNGARASYAGNQSLESLAIAPAFCGEFDGNGMTISGLSSNGYVPAEGKIKDNAYVYGLFGVTDTGANIHDLTLSNVAIDTSVISAGEGVVGDSVGALVGYSAGALTVENVTVSGTVKAVDAVGGIVGRCYSKNGVNDTKVVSITNCTSSAAVTGDESAKGTKAAGIVGYIADNNSGGHLAITVKDNRFTGTVSGADYNSPIAIFKTEMFHQDGEVYVGYTDGTYANVVTAISGNTASGATTELKGNAIADEGSVVYLETVKTYVAQIGGGNSYTTFEAAVDAATAGQTIKLLDDIDVTAQVEVGKELTLDLAGHKIEYTGTATLSSGVIMVLRGGNLTVTDSSGNNTGMIKSGDNAYAAIALTKAGEIGDAAATLTVNGGTLEGYYYGIVGNGSRHGTVINVTGGVLTGTNGAAIYHPQEGTLTISGGSLTGGDSGIEVRAGSLTVNGGTITGTASPTSVNPNGSGTTSAGAGIAVAQHITKLPINVTISGGTIEGYSAFYESNPQGNSAADLNKITLSITGGNFNTIHDGTVVVYSADKTGFITGGSYSSDPSEYVALGYEATQSGSEWTVGKKNVTTLAVTQKENSSAAGAESNLSSTDNAVVITAATPTTPRTATITPVTVSGGVTDVNKGKVTEIVQDTLTEYAVANDIEKVEIVTGLSATQSVGGNAAPQTIIKDNDGKTIFEAVARGGGLRFDNKVNSSGQTYGKSGDGASKTNAIDYVDLRLQYEFKLPDGVDVAANSTSWYWTFKYRDNNNEEQSATVKGTNYLPVANKTNTYTSNVLVLNVPLAHIADDFKAMLTITYVLDGVTYTVSQSESTPLARVITDLAWSYSGTELTQMGTAATNYITALKNVITAYMNEKSGNSGWTYTH